IATDRRANGGSHNEVWGVDTHLAFARSAQVDSFISKAYTPGRETDSVAGRFHALNDGDLWVGEIDYVRIGQNFDPQVGFVRRRDVDRWYGRAQVSPRPKHGPVRKVFGGVNFDYARDGSGRLETREAEGVFKVELHSADIVEFTATRRLDAPDVAFPI